MVSVEGKFSDGSLSTPRSSRLNWLSVAPAPGISVGACGRMRLHSAPSPDHPRRLLRSNPLNITVPAPYCQR